MEYLFIFIMINEFFNIILQLSPTSDVHQIFKYLSPIYSTFCNKYWNFWKFRQTFRSFTQLLTLLLLHPRQHSMITYIFPSSILSASNQTLSPAIETYNLHHPFSNYSWPIIYTSFIVISVWHVTDWPYLNAFVQINVSLFFFFRMPWLSFAYHHHPSPNCILFFICPISSQILTSYFHRRA